MSRFKIMLIGAAMVILGAVSLAVATPSASMAQSAQPCAKEDFLGFPTWYKGLVNTSDCTMMSPEGAFPGDNRALAKYIWKIALNVLEIVLRVIGIIAVAFMIYGGFLYLTSSGSPEKAASAMKTIVNASVGLIIALGVTALKNLIWGVIAGGTNDYGVYDGSAANVLEKALNLVYYIGGAIAVVMIVISGLNYTTSSGDPGKMTKAKNTLLYSIIGLVIIIAAWGITKFIVERF